MMNNRTPPDYKTLWDDTRRQYEHLLKTSAESDKLAEEITASLSAETAALRAELDAAQNRAEAADRFASAAADRVVAEMERTADAWRRVGELKAELATTRAALTASAQRAEAADNRAAELAEELDARSDASGDALNCLWKEVILAKAPDYGDWEYPGQAYRHLIAEFNALRAELDETRAELDALKAAQEWQPGSIRPPAPDWYQTAEAEDGDGSFSHAYFDGVAWLGYPGNQPPMWYRLISPLPTAPDQEVQP
jgi:hypothetical protein